MDLESLESSQTHVKDGDLARLLALDLVLWPQGRDHSFNEGVELVRVLGESASEDWVAVPRKDAVARRVFRALALSDRRLWTRRVLGVFPVCIYLRDARGSPRAFSPGLRLGLGVVVEPTLDPLASCRRRFIGGPRLKG